MQEYAHQRKRRDDRHDDQREPPVEREDRDDAAGHIEQRVQHVHQAPRHHLRQAPHVRDHARHQVAHGRPVVKREGERLQLFKRLLPDGVGDLHLHPARARDEQERAHALHEHAGGVRERKAPKPRARARRDEPVDGVAREQRIGHVHQRHHHEREQHRRHQAPVAQRIAVQPLPHGQIDPLRGKILLLDASAHAVPPPSACMSWMSAMRR